MPHHTVIKEQQYFAQIERNPAVHQDSRSQRERSQFAKPSFAKRRYITLHNLNFRTSKITVSLP